MRMNPPIIHGSKVGEDPQEFLDGLYNVLSVMGVTSRPKAELAYYQLSDVSQIWYTQWKDNRPEVSGFIELEGLIEAFLGNYFPCERREVRVEELISIKQGNMRVDA